jgi:hypothetical protein
MSIRQVLFSTIALAILPVAGLRAADTAEYVGGTVKTIPMNATGFIEFNDTNVLIFNYGVATYKLPYEEITGTEVTKGDSKHVLKKLTVPKLFGTRKETLTISYKDAAGVTGKLDFDLSGRLASGIIVAIAQMKEFREANAERESAEWWGDKYWKTVSNKPVWDANSASAAQQAPAPAPAAAPAPSSKN